MHAGRRDELLLDRVVVETGSILGFHAHSPPEPLQFVVQIDFHSDVELLARVFSVVKTSVGFVWSSTLFVCLHSDIGSVVDHPLSDHISMRQITFFVQKNRVVGDMLGLEKDLMVSSNSP